MELRSKEERRQFYKIVFALVLPMALQNIINAGKNTADIFMLGFIGEDALAGASLANQLQFIMSLVFFGVMSGASVITAQYWGAGDVKTIEKVFGIALRIVLIAATIFTAIALIIPEKVMWLYSKETPVIKEGVTYMRIVGCSYLIMAFTTVYLGLIRSIERVVISMVVYATSFVINLGLNAILIFGLFGFPKMGVAGAAIATVISRVIELVIVVIYAKRGNPVFKFRFKSIFESDPILMHDFWHFSVPVMLNELIWGAGSSMTAMVISNLGAAAAAANSVAQVARELAQVVSFGLAGAAAVLIGKEMGRNEFERARVYAKRFIVITLIFSAFGSLLILAARPICLSVLELSEAAKADLSIMMFIMMYFVIAQAYNTTMIVGIFRSGGDTRFGLVIDVSGLWCVAIPLGALAAFVFKWDVRYVYLLVTCDEIVKLPICTVRYLSGKWQRNIVR